MSQGQGWNTPDDAPYYQQQPTGQAYPPPPQAGYPVTPYQQPYPPGYAAPPVVAVVPKSPAIALLISFFIPGVGSLYAGKINTGVIILICSVISWVMSAFLIGIPFAIGLWVWGMIDAYKGAQDWNRAHGIAS